MGAFDDVRLPEDIEIGATGGPSFSTAILTLANGQEQRNQNWSRARSSYDIAYGITESTDPDDSFKTVIAFFYARAGRARGFRFKDWLDYSSETSQTCSGVVNGTNTVFQLVKSYTSGGVTFVRKISRPVVGTIVLYNNGVAVAGSAWTLGTFGAVTFTTAPLTGHIITADYEFDVPVRFDNDKLALQPYTPTSAQITSIPLMELIE